MSCLTVRKLFYKMLTWRRSITKVDVMIAVIYLTLVYKICMFLLWQSSWKPWVSSVGHHVPPSRNSEEFRPASDFIKYFPSGHYLNKNNGNKSKIILIWTDFFNLPNWVDDKSFSGCSLKSKSCHITFNKSLLSKSDAVVFHTFNVDRFSLPPIRLPNQRWVLYSWEPPFRTGIAVFLYNNIFNWTMLFREDSDFRVLAGPKAIPRTLQQTPKEALFKEIEENIKSKSKLVAARIGNCYTLHSNRLSYIREMQKHIQLDFYGVCGDIDCTKTPCDVLNSYKFYLAFENGFCRGYVSEKFWNAIWWGSVPVVSGGSHINTYKEIAPPGSYINAADFASPKHLAEYLLYLDGNDTAYKEFFKWKIDFELKQPGAWCDMCKALHADEDERPAQVYHNLHGWYLEDTCDYRAPWGVVFPMVVIIILVISVISFKILSLIYNLIRRQFKNGGRLACK